MTGLVRTFAGNALDPGLRGRAIEVVELKDKKLALADVAD